MRMGLTRIPLYSLVFHCTAVGGELAAHPLETTDVGWFARDALPTPLAGYDRWGDFAFAAIEGTSSAVWFDEPRDPPLERLTHPPRNGVAPGRPATTSYARTRLVTPGAARHGARRTSRTLRRRPVRTMARW